MGIKKIDEVMEEREQIQGKEDERVVHGAFEEECILLLVLEDLEHLSEAIENGAGTESTREKLKGNLENLRSGFAGDPPLSLFAEEVLKRLEKEPLPGPAFLGECRSKADELIGYVYELRDGMEKDELEEFLYYWEEG
jgi:hypothetical protein